MSEQGADGTATGEDTGRLRRGLASSADDVAGGDDGAHGKEGRRSTGGQQATGEAPAPETHTSKHSRRSRTCDAGVNRPRQVVELPTRESHCFNGFVV